LWLSEPAPVGRVHPAMTISNDLMGRHNAHICVDMQRMFAEPTDWHAPWLDRTLPAVVEIAGAHSARTIFTRFIPPKCPEAATGAWRGYYNRWRSMTRDHLPAGMLDLVAPLAALVPPARVLDKGVYSPWSEPGLHATLSAAGVDTVVVTGGETDVCVLATVLGALDRGYRIVLPLDAVFGSADQTHDAVLDIYRSRFGQQLATCTTQDVLDYWRHTE
jgi:nicotinamidase-related amidase